MGSYRLRPAQMPSGMDLAWWESFLQAEPLDPLEHGLMYCIWKKEWRVEKNGGQLH